MSAYGRLAVLAGLLLTLSITQLAHAYSPICKYTPIGFNPWERWNAVALNSQTQSAFHDGAQFQGRFAGYSLEISGGAQMHLVQEPWISGGNENGFSLTLDGTFNTHDGAGVSHGGVEAEGAVTLHANVAGNVVSVTSTVIAENGPQVVGGGISAKGDVSITGGASVSGDVITSGLLTVNNGGTVSGNTIEGSHALTGNNPGTHTIAVGAADGLSLSANMDTVKAYFADRAAVWGATAEDVMSVTKSLSCSSPSKREITIQLHAKMNFVTSITRAELQTAARIILTGHPLGAVIINIPGTDGFTLSSLPVYYQGSDGAKQQPTFGRVLFNLYQSTKVIDFGNIGDTSDGTPSEAVRISLLAPYATYQALSAPANIKGNVIAGIINVGAGSTIALQPFGYRTPNPNPGKPIPKAGWACNFQTI